MAVSVKKYGSKPSFRSFVIKLLGQRFIFGVLTLGAASVLIFISTELLPGDLASALLGQSATPENLAAIRDALHLGDPAHLRYLRWLGAILRGDLGFSLTTHRAVAADIAPRLENTFFLAAYAAAVSIPLAVFLGVVSVIRRGGLFDRLASLITLLTISVPEFFVAYLLIFVLAAHLGWFPVLANVTPATPFAERLYLTFLPMLTLVLVVIAHMMRMTRAAIISVMSMPYIEMAVLKGLSVRRIVTRHALPNVIGPILNVIALNVAYLVVGVVVVEVVFVYPGLGQFLVDAVAKRDVPVVQACGLIFASVFILLNILADIFDIASNPRLRQG